MNSPIYKLPFCLVIYVIGNYDSISAMPTLQWLKENDGGKLHGSNRTTLYTCVYNYKQCRKKDQICDPTAIDECQTYVLPEDLNKTRCCEVNPRALTLKEQHDCYNWFFSDNANDAVLAVCAQNKDKRKTESPTSSTTITTTHQEETKTTPGPILTTETSKCPTTSTWKDYLWTFPLGFLGGLLVTAVLLSCCLYHCEESTIDSLGKKLKRLQCRKQDTKGRHEPNNNQYSGGAGTTHVEMEPVSPNQRSQDASVHNDVLMGQDNQIKKDPPFQHEEDKDKEGSGQASEFSDHATSALNTGAAKPERPKSLDHDSAQRRMSNREKEQRDGREKQKRSPEATPDDSNAETGSGKAPGPNDPASSSSNNGGARPKIPSPRYSDAGGNEDSTEMSELDQAKLLKDACLSEQHTEAVSLPDNGDYIEDDKNQEEDPLLENSEQDFREKRRSIACNAFEH